MPPYRAAHPKGQHHDREHDPRPLGRRRRVGGHIDARGRRLQPRPGHGAEAGAVRLHRRCRERRRCRIRGLEGVAGCLDLQAHGGHVRLPRAAQRTQGRTRGDPDGRARQGALGRTRRDRPRHGGRRVRVRARAPHEGRLLRERLDGCRRLHAASAASASSGSSAPSTSPPWCRCGSSRSRSRPATPSS